jgi:hypothetical protein
MWFAKNKNVTMLHNLLRNWPVMMEASSLHVTWIKKKLYSPQEKNEVDDVNKASETVCALRWVRHTILLYRWCRLSNPIKKKLFQVFQYSIDVVAVNYAVFAISV